MRMASGVIVEKPAADGSRMTVEGAIIALQMAGSMAALASGRQGKYQAPYLGHLPAYSRMGIATSRFGDFRILVLIAAIPAQEFLREIGEIEFPELTIVIREHIRWVSLR